MLRLVHLQSRRAVASVSSSSSSLLSKSRCFSTNGHPFVFESRHEYNEYLQTHQSRLPWGFSVATTSFEFVPQEAPHLPATMTLSLIKPVKPTSLFGAVFTQNAFPGAPVLVGRKRLHEEKLGAILVNNKISNVCASGGGVTDAQEVCDALAKHLRLESGNLVLPSSTGVIGWRIPVDAMIESIPQLVENLQSESVLPVAEGIMTTGKRILSLCHLRFHPLLMLLCGLDRFVPKDPFGGRLRRSHHRYCQGCGYD